MNKASFAATLSLLLFAIGCAVTPADAQESTSETARLSSPDDPATDPTIPPRQPAIPPQWICLDTNCFYLTNLVAVSDCPQNYVCLYQDINRGGAALAVLAGHTANLDDFGFDNEASSWLNHSGRQYCWYYGLDFKGVFHHMGNGDGSNMSPADNDQASSLRPC